MQYNPLFADISSNNPMFDPAEYAAAGHVLIAIKATEGDYYLNPDHSIWVEGAHRAKLGVMHYHYANSQTVGDPVTEAGWFLSHALPYCGPWDYLAVDYERFLPGGAVADAVWIREFHRHVALNSRFNVILYADRSELQRIGPALEIPGLRVWEADWSEDPDYAPIRTSVFARQFTDGTSGPQPHSAAGIGRCDMNQLNQRTYWHLLSATGRQ